MSTLTKILIATVLILVIAVALLWRGNNGAMPTLPVSIGQPADTSRLDQLERTQDERYAELSSKLDRLAAHFNDANAKPAREPRPQMPRTEAEMLARTQAVRSGLENRFLADPVDPEWALASSRNIEATLSSDEIAEIGAEPPMHSDINCRSSMCRIEMYFASEEDAADAGTVLNMGIASRLPYTQVLTESLPDGSTQLVVYASRDKPGR